MDIVKTETAFADDRGAIVDLVENASIDSVTIVTFKEGAIRGNHFHMKTKQWNYVLSGRIRLVAQNPGEEVQEVVMEEGDLVLTPDGERHALMGMTDSRLLVLTAGPRGGTQYESDTYRLDEPLIAQVGSADTTT